MELRSPIFAGRGFAAILRFDDQARFHFELPAFD